MLQPSSVEAPIELLRETAAPLFVINLCASTTPVALAHPDSPELKRFTFFVTRRREEGRERFRLHMGYFETLQQAEAMLEAVRDIYPAAWAGPAPDHRGPTPRTRPNLVVASAPTPTAAPAPAAVAAPIPAPAPAKPGPATLSFEETMTNMREVLAHLDETQPSATTTLTPAQTLSLLEASAPPAPTRTAAHAPAPAPAPAPAEVDPAAISSSIRVLTPEDTQTLRDIRLEQQQNAPASFAVQLVWSVQPIDTDALPHLAIFDAYTLYHVEGNRNGRRWYGLRLGFFSDPEAARQVAHYVRSEYAAVAVVPVTSKEKSGADGSSTGENRAPAAAAPAAIATPAHAAAPAPVATKPPPAMKAPAPHAAAPVPTVAPLRAPPPEAARIPTVKPLETLPPTDLAGFELLPDEPVAAKRDLDDAAPAKPAAAPQPPKATGKAPGKRAVVRPRQEGPKTLEETLEILGASTLTLDESREIINDSALRKHAGARKERTGRFARLLSRLSDRNAG